MKTGKPRRHAQIHLPPLDAGYALTLAGIFERAIAAIWRAHGDRMAELLTLRDSARRTPKPARRSSGIGCSCARRTSGC